MEIEVPITRSEIRQPPLSLSLSLSLSVSTVSPSCPRAESEGVRHEEQRIRFKHRSTDDPRIAHVASSRRHTSRICVLEWHVLYNIGACVLKIVRRSWRHLILAEYDRLTPRDVGDSVTRRTVQLRACGARIPDPIAVRITLFGCSAETQEHVVPRWNTVARLVIGGRRCSVPRPKQGELDNCCNNRQIHD